MKVPGCDWTVIQLGIAGSVCKFEVDTHHFKGNFPESCLIEGWDAPIRQFAGGGGGGGIEDKSGKYVGSKLVICGVKVVEQGGILVETVTYS